MLKRAIFFVVVCLTCTFFLSAQKTNTEQIIGIVKTSDGKPAEGVCVALEGTNLTALTDGRGYFSLSAPAGNYVLSVFSISAHKKQYQVTIRRDGRNFFPDLTVLENKNQLGEVVVTGQFAPQSLRSSLYKVRVINQRAIAQKAPLDLQSLLNTELGIRIANDMNLGESNFELMGMSGNNVKILLDGVPLVDRGATRQSLSQIDINSVEQIEIVEGPMSVVYGTDALAGVINIITRKIKASSVADSYSIAVRLQEESIGDEYDPLTGKGLHNQNLRLAWASRKGIYLNGGYSRNESGGWTGDKQGREKTWLPKDQYFYESTLGYKTKDLNVWYRLNYLDEAIYTPLNPSSATPTQQVDQNFFTDRLTHQLQANWKLSGLLSVNAVSSWQDYKRTTRTIVTDNSSGAKWLSSDDASQDVTEYNAAFVRATAVWKMAPRWSFQPGIEYNRDEGAGGRLASKHDVSSFAAFLSAEWELSKELSVRPGVRTILSSSYDAPLAIPSLNAKWSINQTMDLRVAYAYGFRAPTLQELYFSFHDANHNIDGNPDLKAEYSASLNGSFSWRIVHNELVRATSTWSGFYNVFNDRIVLAENESDQTKNTYYNISKYRTLGATWENMIDWKNFQVQLALSVVGRYNNLADNASLQNQGLPQFRFSPEVSSSIAYQLGRSGTRFNIFYKFTGKRYEYQYNSVSGELYLGGLRSYQLADFTVSQPLGKYIVMNGGMRNLFDVTILNNTTFSLDHTSADKSGMLGCGRSYFFGLNFLLNK